MKRILCLDFDGVIHSYTSDWKGAPRNPRQADDAKGEVYAVGLRATRATGAIIQHPSRQEADMRAGPRPIGWQRVRDRITALKKKDGLAQLRSYQEQIEGMFRPGAHTDPNPFDTTHRELG